MKAKDIITGFILLVVIIVIVLLIKQKFLKKAAPLVLPTPSTQERISESFKGLEIPEDPNKIELKSVSGEEGVGIVSGNMVAVDLKDPEPGYFYQVWKEVDGNLVSLGQMRMAKGGYILEGNINANKVVVSKEKIFDSRLEVRILEGSR